MSRAVILVLLTTVVWCPQTSAVTPPDATVTIGGGRIRVGAGDALCDLTTSRLRLRVRDESAGRTVLRSFPGTFFYERAGTVHELGAVLDAVALVDGAQLTVATDEGQPALVTVRAVTRRTFEVTVEPPDGAGVAALGARLRSPRNERIYGLTERLRDSPSIAPGLLDQPIDDSNPPE